MLKKNNGDLFENPYIDGLKIDFFGKECYIETEEGGIS